MNRTDRALDLLGQLQCLVEDASGSSITISIINELAKCLIQLQQCLNGDGFAVRQLDAIERGLEYQCWKGLAGDHDILGHLILDMHVLSGHLLLAESEGDVPHRR